MWFGHVYRQRQLILVFEMPGRTLREPEQEHWLRRIFSSLDRKATDAIKSRAGSKEARDILRSSIKKLTGMTRMTGPLTPPSRRTSRSGSLRPDADVNPESIAKFERLEDDMKVLSTKVNQILQILSRGQHT